MIKYSDITINCKQCGKDFTFSEDEQEFYKTKGFTTPQRCKQCRSNQRQQTRVCAECGSSFVEGAPVYCAACMINHKLDQNVTEQMMVKDFSQADFDSQMESKLSALEEKHKKLLEEVYNRLASAEAAQASSSELLKEKSNEAAELQLRLSAANLELEKASQFRSSLERLEPALKSLTEKLGLLENNQNKMAELLLKLTEKAEEAPKSSLLDTIRSVFRAPDSPAPSR